MTSSNISVPFEVNQNPTRASIQDAFESSPTVGFPQDLSWGASDLIVGLHYIYILPSKTQSSLKIGRSDDPYARISQLVKIYPDIDLAQSLVIAVDTNQIETILKIVFKNRGRCRENHLDGFTEWFDVEIKEDVIDFCLRIADHRCFQYSVQRGLENAIGRNRDQNLPSEKRRNDRRRSKRTLKGSAIATQLCRLAAEQAHCFTLRLEGRCFDRVYRDGTEYLVARRVYRSEEPECWKSGARYWASTWSQEIRAYSVIRIHLDNGECYFRLISTSFFEAENDEIGREYFLVSLPPEEGSPRDDWAVSPGVLAARYFWRAFRYQLAEGRVQDIGKMTSAEAIA